MNFNRTALIKGILVIVLFFIIFEVWVLHEAGDNDENSVEDKDKPTPKKKEKVRKFKQ